MHVKEMDLDDDMIEVIEAHQREYRLGKGVWRRVEYTDDIYILVRRKRSTTGKAEKFRVFLVEVQTNRFVSVMMLDPDTISFKDKEIFYTPTSYILPEYRGRGLFMPLYRWVLNSGFKLKADIRQSEDSNRLWHRFIEEYEFLTINDSQPSDDTYAQMLDTNRLRRKGFCTLLFPQWSQQQVREFAERLTRE